MVYKYECNAMRKGSSVCHNPVSSSQPTQRAVSVCVCRGAQLFFYLGAKERERKVSRLLTWSLISGTNMPMCACACSTHAHTSARADVYRRCNIRLTLLAPCRLQGWIWLMMKVNQKGVRQNTCPHLNNGPMCLTLHFRIMHTTATLTYTH